MSTSAIYLGIDVAKAMLDVGSSQRHLFRAANSPAGYRDVITRLRQFSVGLITIESTGIYAVELVRALILAEFPVAVVQAGRARHFAKSLNLLAKTDAIDSVVLARYGEAAKPRLFSCHQRILRACVPGLIDATKWLKIAYESRTAWKPVSIR
jgi:transposase